ncbi:alpha/beta hydrolase [Rhodococcus aerolatus]
MDGAGPFTHAGDAGAPGVLLCHGFTGSPQSMRPWGEHLAREGFAVRCPRLPGHGTRWQELNTTRWPDWYGWVEAELAVLAERGAPVLVFGLSVGGALALRLAARHPEVAGVCVVNTSLATRRRDAPLLPLLSRLVPSLPGVVGDIARPGVTELGYDRLPLRAARSLTELWREVRADLPRVVQPLLVYRSAVDHVVEPVSGEVLLAGVGSTDVTEVVLQDSYHVATLDNDAPTIFAGSVEHARRVVAGAGAARTGGRGELAVDP